MPCITRWNSRYDSVKKACSFGLQSLNTLIERLKNETSATTLETLTNSDMAVLNEYLKVMTPIATSLDRLQGEKSASQGYIMPTLGAMKHRISQLQGGNLLQSFKRTALEIIEKRFLKYFDINETNRDLVLASVSTPMFKLNFMEKVSDQRIGREILLAECLKQSNVIDEEHEAVQHIEHEGTDDDFFISFQSNISSRRVSIEDTIELEVTRYLSDNRKELNMLDEYPTIKRVYIQYNTTFFRSDRTRVQSFKIDIPSTKKQDGCIKFRTFVIVEIECISF